LILYKKHFIGIADTIAKLNLSKESHIEVIEQFISYLYTTNPSFNEAIFRDYINSKIKEEQKLLRIQNQLKPTKNGIYKTNRNN